MYPDANGETTSFSPYRFVISPISMWFTSIRLINRVREYYCQMTNWKALEQRVELLMVWDPITLIVMNTPFCYTSFILLMCIRLIGMRLLFCCSDHYIQYGELIVANKSGITVKFTDTNSISCVSTCWTHFEVWQICDLSPPDYNYFIPATCQLCERLKTMPACHSCHPCHHTTHVQPCHHAIPPPMCNHATIPPMPSHHPCATMPLMPLHHLCATMPPMPSHHPCATMPLMPLHHLCATMPHMQPMPSHHPCATMPHMPLHHLCATMPHMPPMPSHHPCATMPLMPPMPLHHLCATMPPCHPCHHPTHAQPCHSRHPCCLLHHCVLLLVELCVCSILSKLGFSSSGPSKCYPREVMMGTVTLDARECWCHRASTWWGINVIGHQCDRASMWSDISVIGHQCDLESSTSFCISSRIFTPLHNYLDILAFTGLSSPLKNRFRGLAPG